MDASAVERLWEQLVGGYLDHPAFGGHLQRWAELLVAATGCDRDLVLRVLERQGYDLIIDHRPHGDEVDEVLNDLLTRLYDVKPYLICEYVLTGTGAPDAIVATARDLGARCDDLVELIELSMGDEAAVDRGSPAALAADPAVGGRRAPDSAPRLLSWRRFGE